MHNKYRVLDKGIEGDGQQQPTEHLEPEAVQRTSLATSQALYVETEVLPIYVPYIP